MARKSNTITKVCTRTGFKVTGTPDEIAEHFYRDKSQKDGFSPWSKDAERAYNKAYNASLSKAKVTRKGDADAKGVAAFDRTMKAMGARTARKAKASTTKATRVVKARNTRKDNTRSKASKARTTTRRNARRAKGNA